MSSALVVLLFINVFLFYLYFSDFPIGEASVVSSDVAVATECSSTWSGLRLFLLLEYFLYESMNF